MKVETVCPYRPHVRHHSHDDRAAVVVDGATIAAVAGVFGEPVEPEAAGLGSDVSSDVGHGSAERLKKAVRRQAGLNRPTFSAFEMRDRYLLEAWTIAVFQQVFNVFQARTHRINQKQH